MNRAPEAVDKAVDAVRRVEHRLAESAGEVATKTRKTRRKLARRAKATRKDLAKNAKVTGKDLAKNVKKAKETAQHLAGAEPARRRRRWPWLVALLVAAAGTGGGGRSKNSAPPTDEIFTPEPRSEDEKPAETAKQHENGRPQPAESPSQRKN